MDLRSAVVAVALFTAAVPVVAQKAVPLPRVGVAITPPKGWIELPAGDERGHLLLRFAAPRALAAKTGGIALAPNLRVAYLPSGAATEVEVEGLPRRLPFRDLDDWIVRGHVRGTTVGSREDGRIGALEGERFVAEVPDPAGTRTLIGGAAAVDGGTLIVVFEILSEHAGKLRKDVERALASLEQVELDRAATPVERRWRPSPQVGDAAARAAERLQRATAIVAAAESAPEFGWKATKAAPWLVLSAADPGFTRKAIAAAEAARAWCETKLGSLRPATALPAVLRIFPSPDHYRLFKEGDPDQREYSAARRELYFLDDPDAGTSDGYGMVFRAVVWQWLDDADPDLLSALPRWLDNGLWEYLRSTRLDRKKIEFIIGEVERGRLDYQNRAGTMPAIWNLMQESIQPSAEDGKDDEPWGYTPECARLVRWLIDGDGAKVFGKPDLVATYLRGIADAHRATGPDPTWDVDLLRLSDAQRRVCNQRLFAWRDALLKSCNDTVVPLSVEDWNVVNAAWLKYCES